MAFNGQNNGGEGEAFMKHDSLWFWDGNIILAAASSSDKRLSMRFRVHKSVLSRESQVFSDMFALPIQYVKPISNDDIMEGLPFIRMHDSAEDVEALLKYLYGLIRDVALTRPRHPDFAKKSRGILWIADKYGMDGVKAHFIARLRADWPKTLAEWDRMDAIKETVVKFGRVCVDTWPEELLPEPVSAAILAMEFGVEDILPSIFYEMLRCYSRVDWDTLGETKTVFNPDERGARWQLATAEILHLRNIIREEGDAKMKALLSNLRPNTTAHSRHKPLSCCFSLKSPPAIETLLRPTSTVDDILQSSRDWLRFLRQGVPQSRFKDLAMCNWCRSYLDEQILSGRNDFWRFLQETTASASCG
ncbi:hypothetical protein SCHPADRAFT_940271 [Schizopora paradoxa]|uniref:BTB domain-containing protein n=1 Tax=Schizopora paradoxa TaxID=27342 RepID=A0A0H2S9R6_9AGAM|nr:hypothetical protein SCHPADRAFT_940271 [Schizopora paradoxa]